jgi:hypothetical protein
MKVLFNWQSCFSYHSSLFPDRQNKMKSGGGASLPNWKQNASNTYIYICTLSYITWRLRHRVFALMGTFSCRSRCPLTLCRLWNGTISIRRTPVCRTPVRRTPENPSSLNSPVCRTPVRRTPVCRTPQFVELQFVEFLLALVPTYFRPILTPKIGLGDESGPDIRWWERGVYYPWLG